MYETLNSLAASRNLERKECVCFDVAISDVLPRSLSPCFLHLFSSFSIATAVPCISLVEHHYCTPSLSQDPRTLAHLCQFSLAPNMHQVGLQPGLKAHVLECFHSIANWKRYLILQKQTLWRCFPSQFGRFCHRCARICNYSNVPFHPPQLSLAMFPLIRKLAYNLRLELEHKAVIAPFCLSLCRIYVVKLRRLLCLNLSTPRQ